MSSSSCRFHVVLVEGSVAQRLAIGDILALRNARCTAFATPPQAIEFLQSNCSNCEGKRRKKGSSSDATRNEANSLLTFTGLVPSRVRQQRATAKEVAYNREKRPADKAFFVSAGRASLRRKAGSRVTGITRGVLRCRHSAATTPLNVYRGGMLGQQSFAAVRRPRGSYMQHDSKRPYFQPEGSRIASPSFSGPGGPSRRLSPLLPVVSEVQGSRGGRFLRASADIVHLVVCDINYSEEGDVLRLLEYTRAGGDKPRIPVLLLAGPQEPIARIARVMAAGAVGVLRTPLTMEAAASITAYADLVFNAEKSHRGRGAIFPGRAELPLWSEATCCCAGQSDDLMRVYEQIGVIGKGATSTIYLVRRLSDSKLLALKEIPLYLFSPREKATTVNEIAIMQQFGAPPMIGYADSWLEGDTLKILMEYAEGGTLHDFIQRHRERKKPIPFSLITKWTASLALGLEILHEKNIIHRDLKGQNVLLTKDLDVRLCDFEVSLGTPYSTPSDLWALGVLVYELLHMRRPFEGVSVQALFQTIQKMEPAWHGYTVCNGFCRSDSVSGGSAADGRYTSHHAVAATTEQPRRGATRLGVTRPSWFDDESRIPGAGRGSGLSSASSGEFALQERNRGEIQQIEPCCTFLVSKRRQKLQELAKRLLSKIPSNRPTALNVCCHPLLILDVLCFLRYRHAPDSAVLRQKIVAHFNETYRRPCTDEPAPIGCPADINSEQAKPKSVLLPETGGTSEGATAISLLGCPVKRAFALPGKRLGVPTWKTKREGLTPARQAKRQTREGLAETSAARSPGALLCSSNAAVKPLPQVKFSRQSLDTKALGEALHSGRFLRVLRNADAHKRETSRRIVSALARPFTRGPGVHRRITPTQGECGSSRASQSSSQKMAGHRSVLRQAALCREPILFSSKAAGRCEVLPLEGEPRNAKAPEKARIFHSAKHFLAGDENELPLSARVEPAGFSSVGASRHAPPMAKSQSTDAAERQKERTISSSRVGSLPVTPESVSATGQGLYVTDDGLADSTWHRLCSVPERQEVSMRSSKRPVDWQRWWASAIDNFRWTPQNLINAHADCPLTLGALAFSLHRAVGKRRLMSTTDAPPAYLLSFVAALAAAAATAAAAVAVSRAAILVAMYGSVLQRHAGLELGIILAALITSALFWAVAFQVGCEQREGSEASSEVHLACDALDWLQNVLQVSRERAICVAQEMVDRRQFEVLLTNKPQTSVSRVHASEARMRLRLADLFCLRASKGLVSDSPRVFLRAGNGLREVEDRNMLTMKEFYRVRDPFSTGKGAAKLATWELEEVKTTKQCKFSKKRAPSGKLPFAQILQNLGSRMGDDPLLVSLALLRSYCGMLPPTSAGKRCELTCCSSCSCTPFATPPELWDNDLMALRTSEGFRGLEEHLRLMAALETSQVTEMPSYARLAFVMNMAQLLQRRRFILERAKAAWPRIPPVENTGFLQRFHRFAGLLRRIWLTFWIIVKVLLVTQANLLLFLGSSVSGSRFEVGAFLLAFASSWWAVGKATDKPVGGPIYEAGCRPSSWFVSRDVLYKEPFSAAILVSQLCASRSSKAFVWQNRDTRALCFLLGSSFGFFPLIAFDSDVDLQLSAFVHEYIAAHVRVRRGVIELPAFFLSHASRFAGTQRESAWQGSPPAAASSFQASCPSMGAPGPPDFPVEGRHFRAFPKNVDKWDRRIDSNLLKAKHNKESAALPWRRCRQCPALTARASSGGYPVENSLVILPPSPGSVGRMSSPSLSRDARSRRSSPALTARQVVPWLWDNRNLRNSQHHSPRAVDQGESLLSLSFRSSRACELDRELRGCERLQEMKQLPDRVKARQSEGKFNDPFLAALMRRNRAPEGDQAAAPHVSPIVQFQAFFRGSSLGTVKLEGLRRRQARLSMKGSLSRAFRQKQSLPATYFFQQGKEAGLSADRASPLGALKGPMDFEKGFGCGVQSEETKFARRDGSVSNSQTPLRFLPFRTSCFSADNHVWRNKTELVASLSPACVCHSMGSLAGNGESDTLHLQQSLGRQACCACVGAALKVASEVCSRGPHVSGERFVQSQQRAAEAAGSQDYFSKPCPMGKLCRRLAVLRDAAGPLLRSPSSGRLSASFSAAPRSSLNNGRGWASENVRGVSLFMWLVQHSALNPDMAEDYGKTGIEWKPFVVQPVLLDSSALGP